MFIAGQPNVPPTMPAVVMLAQASSAHQDATKPDHIAGVCKLVELRGSGQGDLYPTFAANAYFRIDGKPYPKPNVQEIDEFDAKITVLQQPKHGVVEPTDSDGDWTSSRYRPVDGYLGNDSFVMLVEGNGYKVELHYFMYVTDGMGETIFENKDCQGHEWKISDAPPQAPYDLTASQRNAALSTVLANAHLGFFNLPGNAVGQTAGEGLGAAITLDASAAGYGWYIDSTPTDSSEFLATADPTLFKARAGSDAVGKMDLLSVLLHEYGHVLGLEHSGDAVDFMAPTLQAGERRLPTAAQLQTMANLVAELQRAPDPAPGAPAPLPVIAGFGLLAAIRPRRGEFGDTSSYENVALTLPQFRQNAFETALNPTLVDGSFIDEEPGSPEQWLRSGNGTV